MRVVNASPEPPARDSHFRGFKSAPASWYYLGSTVEIMRSPQRLELPDGQKFVGFHAPGGGFAVIDARCSHMGADLSLGCVRNGRLACPLHRWEYATDGTCEHIPSSPEIPAFARQRAFPVEVRSGHVFFFNREEARFPMPFFDGVAPEDLHSAPAFDIRDAVPWYLIGGNGFDRQHFEGTHDRTLLEEPAVDAPHPFARRIRLSLGIGGTSYMDRLTRAFAGRQSKMTVTSWCGTLIFATAQFRHTTNYGLVAVHPLEGWATRCRVIVWVRRSPGAVASRFFDPVHAMIRRHFIQVFLKSDLGKLTGTRYDPGRMIAADKMLVDYLAWLQSIHH